MIQTNYLWLLCLLQVIGLLDVFSPATSLEEFNDVWVFGSFIDGGLKYTWWRFNMNLFHPIRHISGHLACICEYLPSRHFWNMQKQFCNSSQALQNIVVNFIYQIFPSPLCLFVSWKLMFCVALWVAALWILSHTEKRNNRVQSGTLQ